MASSSATASSAGSAARAPGTRRTRGGPDGGRRLGGRRDVLSGRDRHQVDLGMVVSSVTGGRQGEVGGELLVIPHARGQRLGDAVELVQQHARVGRALGSVAGRGARDEGVEVRRDAGHEPRRRRDVLVDVLVGDRDRRLARVRLLAGEELVEDHPRGVDVGAGVAGAVDDQLGSEVGDRADDDAAGRRVLRVGADRLGQPEVGDLDPAVVGDQDVLGLDVAVDDTGR